jgi:hypothetical protein
MLSGLRLRKYWENRLKRGDGGMWMTGLMPRSVGIIPAQVVRVSRHEGEQLGSGMVAAESGPQNNGLGRALVAAVGTRTT